MGKMRRFKELSKIEKKTAITVATNEAMKLIMLGKAEISGGTNHANDITDLLEPIAVEIAEEAFYPDAQDVVIKLWESK